MAYKRRCLIVFMLVGGLLASACGGGGSGSGATSPGSADPPGARRAVERLTVAVASDVGPLNIFTNSDSAMNELVYDQLFAPSPYVEDPQPWLAESITAVDPSTWDLELRDDVRWHDGEAFTADDVRFTMEYFRKAPSGTYTHHVSEVPDIAAEVTGEHALRLRCAFACPDLARITLAFIPILPEHVWSGVTEQITHTELPIGTGPYELVAYDTNQGYRFEANPDYFAGPPLVDELVMPIIEDVSATFTALRTGEVDAAARSLAPELLGDFSGRDEIEVATTSPLQFLELRLNYERTPLDDPELRQALSLAVDRQEILDRVLLGQGRPATQGYPHPDSPWTDPTLSTPFDPGEAAAVLDGAGYRDTDADGVRQVPAGGAPLAFTVKVTGAEPTHVRAAQLLAEDLSDVGMDVEVVTLDAGGMRDLFKSRDFELAVSTIGAHGVADPTQFIMSHRSGYLWNAPEIPYPAWDGLFERWKATTTIEGRTEVLFEMQQLFNRQPTSIPLVYPDENWAFRPAAFDGWVESPGYGIVHKWSLLPPEVSRRAKAIVEEPSS